MYKKIYFFLSSIFMSVCFVKAAQQLNVEDYNGNLYTDAVVGDFLLEPKEYDQEQEGHVDTSFDFNDNFFNNWDPFFTGDPVYKKQQDLNSHNNRNNKEETSTFSYYFKIRRKF